MMKRIPLDKEALQVCENNCTPPFIFQLPPAQGRPVVEKLQSGAISTYPAHVQTVRLDADKWGCFDLHIVIPDCIQRCASNRTDQTAGVIFYLHGGGWVFGSLHTHKKLVCELAARTGCVVFFPEYSRSPEAKFPTAVEQCYYALCRLPQIARQLGLQVCFHTLTVAGDSSGGNLAAVMCLLANQRSNCPVAIHKQLLYYPVTNACFSTPSYRQFACGYYLFRAGMIWFWRQYLHNFKDACSPLAAPLRAGTQQLKALPPAMIINGEADILRDEGELYACKLRCAGVPVTSLRVQGTIHDFVMLNALDQSNACRVAMDASIAWLSRLNCENTVYSS